MPLSSASPRRPIHARVIDMQAYARDDGLYDVEAHLIDRKPYDFKRVAADAAVPAGVALHDLWIRLTLDDEFVVRAAQAASDTTPYALCREAESSLSVLIGQRVAKGWSRRVKELLGGTAGCTHLREMLIPLATTALQGIRGLKRQRAADQGIRRAVPPLDSCYAYAAHREVVKVHWPEHFRGEGTTEKTKRPATEA